MIKDYIEVMMVITASMVIQVNCSKARERGAVVGNNELGEITIWMNKIIIMMMIMIVNLIMIMNMIMIMIVKVAAMMTISTRYDDEDYSDDDHESDETCQKD